MRTSSPVALLALAAAIACLWAAPLTSAPRSPAAGPAPDAEVEREIRERLARSKIGANGFRVRVQNGVAIIEGKTNVLQHKGAATRMAKSAGARTVDNRIEVSEAARQKASANLSKGRRRSQAARGDSRSAPRSDAVPPAPQNPPPRRAVVQR